MQHKTQIADLQDTAGYIAAIAVELRALASDARLDMLAHLLDMVVEEAGSSSSQPVADQGKATA